jgi:serine/threonine protein kinase
MGCGQGKGKTSAPAESSTPNKQPSASKEKPPIKGLRAGEQGTFLNSYTLGKKIGQGGFGVVYSCTDKDGNEYAVKMVDKVDTPLESIQTEVDMQKKLEHGSIVKVHNVFYEPVFVCIVMDICKAGTLLDGMEKHWDSKGMIPLKHIPRIALQMVESIAWLCSNSCVHRDVKGDNYLVNMENILDPKCKLYLSDFGTVKEIKAGDRLTNKCGSKPYWSPEFYALNYGIKVDVWALGVVTYGLICGTFPFDGRNEVTTKVIQLPTRCPKECVDFVKGALEKNEEKRSDVFVLKGHAWMNGQKLEKHKEEKAEDLKMNFKPNFNEHLNAGVNERRDELVDRLEKTKKGTAAKMKIAIEEQFTPITNCDTVVLPNDQALAPVRYNKEFVIEDKAGRATTYSWWTPERVAKTTMYGSFTRKSTVTENLTSMDMSSVKNILQDHNIDMNAFGKNGAASLDTFVDEVQRGVTHLMIDARKHKCLVRVVDIVIVCAFHTQGGQTKFLIKEKEVYSDGQARIAVKQLAGVRKEAYENLVQAAGRVVKEELKMPKAKVRYVKGVQEHLEEEEEEVSPSYPAVKTVYRKMYVEAEIETSDANELKMISEGKPYTIQDDPNKCVNRKAITRHYKWMAAAECQDVPWIKKRGAELKEKVMSGLIQAPMHFEEESLRKFLKDNGIDQSNYTQFADELTKGEASLVLQKNGTYLRVVDVVLLDLKKPNGETLVEASDTFKGQRTKLERLPAAKRRPGDNVFVAAGRVITHLLHLDPTYVSLNPDNVQVVEEMSQSHTFKGLQSQYRKHIVSGTLPEIRPVSGKPAV